MGTRTASGVGGRCGCAGRALVIRVRKGCRELTATCRGGKQILTGRESTPTCGFQFGRCCLNNR